MIEKIKWILLSIVIVCIIITVIIIINSSLRIPLIIINTIAILCLIATKILEKIIVNKGNKNVKKEK